MKRPRDTAYWRRQQRHHTELWQRVRDHPDMRGPIQDAMDGIAGVYVLSRNGASDPRILPLMEQAFVDATSVARSIVKTVPALAQFYGDSLDQAVWRFLAGHALQASGADMVGIPVDLPPLRVSGVPGTSMRLGDQGEILPGATVPSVTELMTLREFLKSYAPEGRPGRPKGKGGVRPNMASKYAEAWLLRQQRRSDVTIAERVLDVSRQDFDPDVGRRVRRYIQRGRELEKKSDTKT